MRREQSFSANMKLLKGKTIAVVYFFEGENAPGMSHYWIWKSNIISGWLNAIQQLECIPFILDVRTFVQKALYGTLPNLDFVLNLNCGCYQLSSLSVVPSVCSFLAIPCIPCEASSIMFSENKRISNYIASALRIPIPQILDSNSETGIYRPLNLGNSIGVEIGLCNERNKQEGTYQQFIPGYDVTIPIVYNPHIMDLDLFPAVIYMPKSYDPKWIYDKFEKEKDDNFQILIQPDIDPELKLQLLNFSKEFPINTFGRIDARIKYDGIQLDKKILDNPLKKENFYFIEMNSMPTIETEDSFEYSLNYIIQDTTHSFHYFVEEYMNYIKNPSIHNFLLTCSMFSLLKPRIKFS